MLRVCAVSRAARRTSARGRIAATALWALVGTAGCQVFMDLDTDGYDAAPTPACGADAKCAAFDCRSAADCEAGEICCGATGASTGDGGVLVAALSCHAGPCGDSAVQFCLSDSECGGAAGSCGPCTFEGVAFRVCTSSPYSALLCH
jgi:hypothetical protein